MRAPRIEASPEFTTQAGSGLMTRWTSFPSCLTMLYIDGEYQLGVIGNCCFARSTLNLLSLGLAPPCSLMLQV